MKTTCTRTDARKVTFLPRDLHDVHLPTPPTHQPRTPTAPRSFLDRQRIPRPRSWRIATPPPDRARGALNEVLARGRLRHTLDRRGRRPSPRSTTRPGPRCGRRQSTACPSWTTGPSGLRFCANPARVLHFCDVPENGTRRWCSMTGCGNRAKASRHYARRSGAT
ncbi:CGNR zinc finger domain-containing protein [Streptomyces sp. NPDC057496]|uniref:CGNR zinc finger domain-containing protein n=1 Tax=Streptomyces sp. NPDC057496 TaxID=3346149 RepID=UPI0036B65230